MRQRARWAAAAGGSTCSGGRGTHCALQPEAAGPAPLQQRRAMLASLARGLVGAPLSAVAAGGALRAAAAGLLLTQHAGSGRSAWEQPCRRLATAAPSDPSLIRNFAIIGEAPLLGQPLPLGQGWPAAMHVPPPPPPAAAAGLHTRPSPSFPAQRTWTTARQP